MQKLLIVEDHESLLEILATAFEERFEVMTARDGCEALQVVRDFKPDIVLTDQTMQGMTGLELLEKVQAEEMKPKVIIVSANVTAELCRRARALGAVDCVSKPFELEDLRERVRQALLN